VFYLFLGLGIGFICWNCQIAFVFIPPSNLKIRPSQSFRSRPPLPIVAMTGFLGALFIILLLICTICALLFFVFIVSCRLRFRKCTKRARVVGFFHPFCSAGGGGERVLWKAIQVLGDLHDKGLPLEVVVYTIDSTKESYKEGMCELLMNPRRLVSVMLLSLTCYRCCIWQYLRSPSTYSNTLLHYAIKIASFNIRSPSRVRALLR
jgi:hypothetical protein